jgi:hypothetical protein
MRSEFLFVSAPAMTPEKAMQSMNHLDEVFYARIGGFHDEFDDLARVRYRHLLGGNTSIAHVFSHKLTNGIII